MSEKFATIDQLLSKPVRTKSVTLTLGDTDVVVKLKALGAKEYDDLLGGHPPTRKQKEDGATFNPDTFAPALMTACMVEPKIELEQATTMWTSPEWSRGELADLFYSAIEINAKGLEVPTTERG